MMTGIRTYHFAGAILVFIGLPVLFLSLGDFPRRSMLKESISLITVVTFSLMLGQFCLARSNRYFIRAFRFSRLLAVHRLVGYAAVAVFLVHPFLIVLPRFFEAGVSPLDALITLVTTFDSRGVVLGLAAWGLMLLVGVTALFRDRLHLRYRTWTRLHGMFSLLLIVIASWHAIELGRHTDKVISVFIILLASTGAFLLVAQYAGQARNTSGAKQ